MSDSRFTTTHKETMLKKDHKQNSDIASKQAGEFIAIKAVEYFAAHPEALAGFLSYTGTGPAELKANINNPDFLASVLDYMMIDEPTLLDFAQSLDLNPQDIVKARLLLPGADAELVCS